MGTTYNAIMRAEGRRKQLSSPTPPEQVPGEWEPPRSNRGLSRWRRWTSNGEVEPHPETAHTALVEQIASLEVTVGALDDQIARELPEIERRLQGQAGEDLAKLEDRLSRLISSAADAMTRQVDQLTRRISRLLWIVLAVLLAIFFRI